MLTLRVNYTVKSVPVRLAIQRSAHRQRQELRVCEARTCPNSVREVSATRGGACCRRSLPFLSLLTSTKVSAVVIEITQPYRTSRIKEVVISLPVNQRSENLRNDNC